VRDYLNLGPTPCEEECAQLGEDDYAARARAECRRYVALIRAVVGPEPTGAQLSVRAFRHDFGTYYEVVVEFDDENPTATAYALRVENKAPKYWGETP